MAKQTKAQRSAAAKKGAATRKRRAAKSDAGKAQSALKETGTRLQGVARTARETAKRTAGAATKGTGGGVGRIQAEVKKRTGRK
jgi:hypothetical protein